MGKVIKNLLEMALKLHFLNSINLKHEITLAWTKRKGISACNPGNQRALSSEFQTWQIMKEFYYFSHALLLSPG